MGSRLPRKISKPTIGAKRITWLEKRHRRAGSLERVWVPDRGCDENRLRRQPPVRLPRQCKPRSNQSWPGGVAKSRFRPANAIFSRWHRGCTRFINEASQILRQQAQCTLQSSPFRGQLSPPPSRTCRKGRTQRCLTPFLIDHLIGLCYQVDVAGFSAATAFPGG